MINDERTLAAIEFVKSKIGKQSKTAIIIALEEKFNYSHSGAMLLTNRVIDGRVNINRIKSRCFQSYRNNGKTLKQRLDEAEERHLKKMEQDYKRQCASGPKLRISL